MATGRLTFTHIRLVELNVSYGMTMPQGPWHNDGVHGDKLRRSRAGYNKKRNRTGQMQSIKKHNKIRT